MKFRWNSKEECKRLKAIDEQTWTKVFAIWPKRISPTEVVVLGSYYYKNDEHKYGKDKLVMVSVDGYEQLIIDELAKKAVDDSAFAASASASASSHLGA